MLNMQQKILKPPRTFEVGRAEKVTIQHVADIWLAADEQLTLRSDALDDNSVATEYDVVRKDWGYYATPSVNRRLSDHHLRTALVVNPQGRLYVMLVEAGKEAAFQHYVHSRSQQIVTWLDTDADVQRLLDMYGVKLQATDDNEPS